MIPGVQPGMSESEYHADPCPLPSLSSGLAKTLVRRSPRHAYHAHARFGGNGLEPNAAMDAGSIVHGLILGRGGDYAVIDADAWTTKAAREARDAARDAGKVPVLAHVMADLERCAEAAVEQMQDHRDCREFFDAGQSEAVITWQEGESWLRCMVDRMPDGVAAPWFDLKTTGMSAAPEEWQRRLISEYAFQAAFYLRAAKVIGRRPPEMRFVAVEVKPPYGLAVFACAPSLLDVAEAEVERAIALWGRCMATNHWPGYATRTAYVDAPPWVIAQNARDEMLAEGGA